MCLLSNSDYEIRLRGHHLLNIFHVNRFVSSHQLTKNEHVFMQLYRERVLPSLPIILNMLNRKRSV